MKELHILGSLDVKKHQIDKLFNYFSVLYRLQDANFKIAVLCCKYPWHLCKKHAVISNLDTSIYHGYNQISLCSVLMPYPRYDQNRDKPYNQDSHVYVNTLTVTSIILSHLLPCKYWQASLIHPLNALVGPFCVSTFIVAVFFVIGDVKQIFLLLV